MVLNFEHTDWIVYELKKTMRFIDKWSIMWIWSNEAILCRSHENLWYDIMLLPLQNQFFSTICKQCYWFTENSYFDTLFAFHMIMYLYLNTSRRIRTQQIRVTTNLWLTSIKPWGHVEFRKLHVNIAEATRSKLPLPQTFTPWGAVLHTRLFTHFKTVYRLSLSPHLLHTHTHTQIFTLSQAPIYLPTPHWVSTAWTKVIL